MFIPGAKRRSATDLGRGIVVAPNKRYTGQATTFTYTYTCGDIKFDFRILPRYEDQVIVDNFGNQHTMQRTVEIYIVERDLRVDIDAAYTGANLGSITDRTYEQIKEDLRLAISVTHTPRDGVRFVDSPASIGTVITSQVHG